MSGIFSIGTSALNAAYVALRTAGNNVANANTPGYSRQTVAFSAQVGASIGGNYVGQGVMIADVARSYDAFLNRAANSAQSAASAAEARSNQLNQVDNLFANTTTGIGASLDAYFKQVQQVSQQPADPAARQALLSSANQLAARLADTGSRLQEARVNTDTQIALEIDAVNRYTSQIASLNDQIAIAQGSGRQPNDLLDARDTAIRNLNQSVRVNTVPQGDGSVNVFLGNGQSLVVGSRAMKMGTQVDPADPQSIQLTVKDGPATTVLQSSLIGGGKIGGLMQFRQEDLPAVENELGRLATTLTDQVNAQHKLGNDLNGAAGGNFFTPLTPTAFPSTANAGAATISVAFSNTTQLQASDYRVDFAGGNYTLTRLSDNVSWTQTTPNFSQDGLTISLANTPPASGDTFMVQAVRGGARSMGVAITQPSQIAAASAVRASLASSNTGSVAVASLNVVGPRTAATVNPTTISFTGPSTYSITDGATTLTGQTLTAGTPITFNGWSLTLTGTPANGDTLTVTPNTGGTGDNRNALALAAIQNRALVGGGQIASSFSAVVARVGAEAQNAQSFNAAQGAILKDALGAESAVSGVNLDEEASRLMQYQQQYQAAAKVIATASTLFQSVLSILQ